jgi:hypothetical protein
MGNTISHMAAVHPGALATGSSTEKKKKSSFNAGVMLLKVATGQNKTEYSTFQ